MLKLNAKDIRVPDMKPNIELLHAIAFKYDVAPVPFPSMELKPSYAYT